MDGELGLAGEDGGLLEKTSDFLLAPYFLVLPTNRTH